MARFTIGIDEVGRAAKKKASLARQKYIVGIDEVGRGSLAGPVVVAAIALPRSRIKHKLYSRIFANRNSRKIREIPLRDSKKLSAKQREAWFEYFKAHPKVNYAIARVYPRQIEKRNISRAANLAAERAFLRLTKTYNLKLNTSVFLDGGLYLGSRKGQMANGKLNVKTIVRGDEKIKVIAAASIVAKVSRDSGMVRLAKEYPQYGFEEPKGYGTRAHMRAIRRHGPSKAHRLTFLN